MKCQSSFICISQWKHCWQIHRVLPFYFYFLIWACKFLSILAYHKTLPDLICLAWPQLLTSNLAWLGILACQASKIVLNCFFLWKWQQDFLSKLHLCKNYGRKRKSTKKMKLTDKKNKWKNIWHIAHPLEICKI